MSADLVSLAAEINAAHAAACEAAGTAIEQARRAGALLIQAKAGLEHGAWLPWLASHCPALAERTAQAYMRIARRWPEVETAPKAQHVADLPIRHALALLAEPREPRTTGDEDAPAGAIDRCALLDDQHAIEADARTMRAELRLFERALASPDLTLDEAAAIVRRAEAIIGIAHAWKIRALSNMGRLLTEADAGGYGGVMRGLLAHPEAYPEFRGLCEARIAALTVSPV